MAFTDFCDVYGGFHEDGFNRIVFHIASQRPSMFNYGTPAFVKDPELLCCRPEYIHPEVFKRGNPVVSLIPYLPIPGYPGNAGLEYNFSLSRLELDFEPTNKFNLPSELGTRLNKQQFAIRAILCGGIACPDERTLEQFVIYPEPYSPSPFSVRGKERGNDSGLPIDLPTPVRGLPFNRENIQCFKLEVYIVLYVSREDYLGESYLSLKLENIEIVDISPDGLENSIECLLRTTLKLGILPQLHIAVNTLVLSIGDFISIIPTLVSPSLPFNPSVEKDTLSVYISIV